MTNVTSPIDLTNQQEVARLLPQLPVVDSYRTGWKGLTFTHYHHPPYETMEHYLLQHSLVITDPKSCCKAERHLDGKLQHCALGSGQVDVIPAFLNHRTNWSQDVEFSVIAICPTLLNEITQELVRTEVELIPQVSINDPVIHQLAFVLKTEIQTGCLSGSLFGESLGSAIAARLVQNYAVHKPKLKASGLAPSQLKRVTNYIQEHLNQDVSVLDLATLTGMSESYFSRSFKRSVGISPYRYLMQQRVERAKHLLKQKDPEHQSISISKIALDCGFANQTHLTKVFRQMIGTTPRAYQKQL